MATKSESDNSQDGSDSDGEVVQPPKKKTKQPLKEGLFFIKYFVSNEIIK